MKTYEQYKDSSLEWVGKIPEHWQILPLFASARESKKINRDGANNTILSLSYGRIIIKNKEENAGLVPENYLSYQIVEPGSLVLRLTDLQNDKRSLRVGHVKDFGIITSAYLNLNFGEAFDGRYSYCLLHFYDLKKFFYGMGGGVRQGLNYEELRRMPIICPPLEEQKAIVRFLERKLERINDFMDRKKRLIALLQEQKAALINQVVTKGLNAGVPMKDSGLEWLGEIPAHWKIKRAKYIFREVDERSESGKEELLSVSHITGVTPRSEKNITMFMAESYEGYKMCRPDDLVINIMWAWMGALGVSSHTGIISSAYGVYRQLKPRTYERQYLDFLSRLSSYVGEYQIRSKGVTSSRARMYTDDFFNIPLLLPSLEEQQEILKFIEKESTMIQKAIATIEKEIELILEYRTTLIADCVTGKIDVRMLA